MWKQRIWKAGLALALAGGQLAGWASPVRAAGVVGTGSPASCDAAALANAVAAGGLVTFNCGGAAHTILLSAYLTIPANTEIQGGGLITLSGGNSSPHFQVFSGRELVLRDLTLTAGKGTFGSIQNFGTLRLFNVTQTGSTAAISGGAIENYGTVQVSGSIIDNNSANSDGGGIYNDGGTVELIDSLVTNNRLTDPTAVTRGGGIYNGPTSTMTISGGEVRGNSAGINGAGGGIYNSGTLTASGLTIAGNWSLEGLGLFSQGTTSLSNSQVVENRRPSASEPSHGGGILVIDGTLTGAGLTIRANHALNGGGLFVRPKGHLILSESVILENTAQLGGGLMNLGSSQISASAILRNTAEKGGAIYANEFVNPGVSAMVLTNLTIAENTTTDTAGTGAIHDNAQLQFKHSAVLNNAGPSGIYIFQELARPYLQNSLIAGHSVDCGGGQPVTSGGSNLSGDATCGLNQPGDLNAVNPQVGALALTGARRSASPLPGSPLIDAAPCLTGIDTDQRGTPRPAGARCDIGPVEYLPETAGLIPAVYIPVAVR